MVSLAPVLQQALLPIGGIMGVGYVWRRARPGGIDAPTARRVIGGLVSSTRGGRENPYTLEGSLCTCIKHGKI